MLGKDFLTMTPKTYYIKEKNWTSVKFKTFFLQKTQENKKASCKLGDNISKGCI